MKKGRTMRQGSPSGYILIVFFGFVEEDYD